jgi:hypothetical protein
MVEDNSSILDKIIASQEDRAKQDFNPQEIIAILLHKLTPKEAEVLQRRFGLSGTPKETLEAIGSSYHVTRERIRQIENLAIKKLRDDPNFPDLIKPVEHVVNSLLEEYGGLMSEQHLLEELFSGRQTNEDEQALLFLLAELVKSRFERIEPNHHFVRSWKLKAVDLEFIQKTMQALIQIIKQHGIPMDLKSIFAELKQQDWYHTAGGRLTEKVVMAHLESSYKIDRNPFSEFGLRDWGSVVPRRMNDKIYLILKKVDKPMHFVDIAQQITTVFKKEAYPPTVHNELILNKNYVLVGRGIYALREWGYKSGVVADVLVDILEKKTIPMTREQLVDAVLEQRVVKKNTIHLALTDKQRFTRLADGRYIVNTAK